MQWSNYSYRKSEDGIVILRYQVETEEEAERTRLEIPARIEGLPVVEIGENAFEEFGMNLQTILLPDTLRRLAKGAFRMCMSLTELTLPEGLEYIGEDAFYLTPLEYLRMPKSLRFIEGACNLGGVRWEIPEDHPHFRTDGYGLYHRCGKEEYDLNDRCKNDGGGLSHRDVGIYSGHPEKPLETTDDFWTLLVVNRDDERECYEVMPETGVIGENAFSGQNFLKCLELPGSVYRISDGAMESCQNLEQVTLHDGLREICQNAFAHCISLEELHLPSTLETLGWHALSDTFGWSDTLNGIRTITVAEGNRHFMADEDALFCLEADGSRSVVKYFGTARSYRIPGDVGRILSYAFRRAGFRELSVPVSVQIVEKDAFKECKHLETICLDESGAKLYIPRNPVYRKDEVAALFQQEKRVQHKLNQELIAQIPEKWKGFAENVVYYKIEDFEDAHDMNYVYDYAGYDLLFDTYLTLPDRIGMACSRVHDPIALNDYFREKYNTFLRINQEDIMKNIVEREDMDMLSALTDIGYFTLDNIEACLDVINRMGKTKLAGFLMNYKQEHLGNAEFDFSL